MRFSRLPAIFLPVERIVVFGLICCLALYSRFQIPLRDPWGLYIHRIESGLTVYAIGFVVSLLILRLVQIQRARREGLRIGWDATWRRFVDLYSNPRRMIRDIRLINAVSVMFVVFVNLKHLVPWVNPGARTGAGLWDEALAGFERKIFSGRLAGEVLQGLLGTNHIELLSQGYTLFYPYVALVIFVMILQRREELAHEFFSAFCLVWFLGVAIVYSVPTLGPCFYFPQSVAGLPESGVSLMQAKLLEHKLFLEANPSSPHGAYLISGLPSLHLAVVLLCTIYLRRLNRWIAIPSWIFFGLTAVTTLYFGWHYLADDISAVFLVALVLLIVSRRMPVSNAGISR